MSLEKPLKSGRLSKPKKEALPNPPLPVTLTFTEQVVTVLPEDIMKQIFDGSPNSRVVSARIAVNLSDAADGMLTTEYLSAKGEVIGQRTYKFFALTATCEKVLKDMMNLLHNSAKREQVRAAKRANYLPLPRSI